MTTTNLNLYQVNTTAWDEEDFLLLTSLTEEQITQVIEPIVLAEREVVNGDVMFRNEDYVHLLKTEYPDAVIMHYNPIDITLISI